MQKVKHTVFFHFDFNNNLEEKILAMADAHLDSSSDMSDDYGMEYEVEAIEDKRTKNGKVSIFNDLKLMCHCVQKEDLLYALPKVFLLQLYIKKQFIVNRFPISMNKFKSIRN